MGQGYLAGLNEVTEAECAVTSNVAWLPTAPLDALRAPPLADAAVSEVLGTAAAPVVVDIVWTSSVYLTYGGLFDTNLRQASYVRMQAWGDAARTELLFDTRFAGRDRRVVPGLTDPRRMRAGAPNMLRGDLEPRDFRLWPTNVHVPVPLCRARAVRWSLWGDAYEPDDSAAPGYRLGLVWAGDGLTFGRDVGSGDGVRDHDEPIEMPGGAVWIEPGQPKRVTGIERAALDRDTRDRLFDLTARVGRRKPVVWLPDVADAAACFRYGGLFRRDGGEHRHRYVAARYASTTIDLEEWKE